jgi:predicted membrane-bound spermidine synthase
MTARWILYLLFFLSGAAALVYETLWARYLGLFVGHSAYAQIIVLAIFLGGMGVGAIFAGRHSARLTDPLAWYARIELIIGLFGVLFHPTFRWATDVAYGFLLPGAGSGPGVHAIKWTIAALAILPQSALLGTTFPLMAAGVLRRLGDQPGRTLSILYFANSLGAAVGALAAGFWLIALAGLPGTLVAAGGLNVVAAAGAFAVAATHPAASAAAAGAVGAHVTDATATSIGRLLLGVAFGTAAASFVYEIAWIRMLALVLGSATHSFELMLSAFILGLALGAFWARRHADRWTRPVRVLGIVQVGMGLAALATLPLYGASFAWMALLMRTFTRTEAGYVGFSLARYGLSLAIMLPATFCAGVTLPLITRILLTRGFGEGAIGRVYGVNTLGSILGVALAGLLLLPWLGLERLLTVGAATDIALGVALLAAAGTTKSADRRLALGTGAVATLVIGVALLTVDFDPRLLASSVFREGVVPPPGSVESLLRRDGRTATITAHRRAGVDAVVISTNGKPDASVPDYWREPCGAGMPRRPLDSDMATQALAPLLALAHAPAARNAAVVGFGSGVSSHTLLGSSNLEQLVSIEIEPEMTEGARIFYPTNRRAYEDPRSVIVHDDAKSYFAAAGDKFDFVFSEPSNPWVSGIASLFSTEFYEQVHRNLADDGVFGQWLHLYETNDQLVLSVLAAIHQMFPDYAVYQAWNADIVIVASARAPLPAPRWDLLDTPTLRDDFCQTIPFTPGMLGLTRLLDRAALEPLLERWGHPNSDYYPVLDLGAERARYQRTSARGLAELTGARYDVAAMLAGRRVPPGDDSLAPVPRIPRMQTQAVAARLRRSASPGDGAEVARARYLVEQWNTAVHASAAPADWGAWLDEMGVAEHAVHGAAQGYADSAFYGAVQRFLDRVGAPDSVRTAVAFRQGLAAWDYAMAAQAADSLLPAVLEGARLIPADDLLDGGVVAKLKVGDVRAAGQMLRALAPRAGRLPDDLRTLMLAGAVEAAGEKR